MKIADAVKFLTAVRGDLALAARGVDVDQKELAAAIAKAPADSADAVVMRMLVRPAAQEPEEPVEEE